MGADATESGPLFDGRAEAALRRGIEAAQQAVADQGKRLTMAVFAGQIRRNRGRFLASITTTGQSRTYTTRGGRQTYSMPVVVDSSAETLVTTDLATYGPWLEGTGSRNETTRFKGYHGFRKAGEELDRLAGRTASSAIAPHIREMS